MELQDLLEKPLSELSEEELETKINLLKHLRVLEVQESQLRKKAKTKSNKEKQLDDMISKLSKEELAILMAKFGGS